MGGEVVNADPYQSYQRLPILTAQPEQELLDLVPHHLYNTTPLDQDLSAPIFAESIQQKAEELLTTGITPVIVTGSGLYFRALTHGIDTSIPPAEPQLRAKLENTPLPDLIDQLYSLDPVSADTIDIHNPHRVVRALEICLLTGKPASELRPGFNPEDISWIRGVFLDLERPFLHQRIAARARHMFDHGVEEEIAALADTKLSQTAANTLGLDLVRDVLCGEIPREGAIDLLTIATRQYAKRQCTWFRKVDTLRKITVDESSGAEELAGQISEALGIGH